MINSTNSDYAITNNSELAYVLSKFNEDFIYNTVNESIQNKLRNYEVPLPNIVMSFEQMFKNTLNDFPGGEDPIWKVREDVYTNIIKILCDHYQLIFDDNDNYDLYSSAMYMYSLLVSEFQRNIVTFFVNYIIKEKSSIYEMLSLSEARKNKDSSTIYTKKVFKNPKLGVISANLEFVLDSICNSFDIGFDDYLEIIYPGEQKIFRDHLLSVLKPTNDFFKEYIGKSFYTPFRPILITSIRLGIQQYAISTDLNEITFIKEEGAE